MEGRRRGSGSRQQLRRHAGCWAGFNKPLVERMHCGAVLRCDAEAQGIAGSKPEHVLIGELHCHLELPTRHAKYGDALAEIRAPG